MYQTGVDDPLILINLKYANQQDPGALLEALELFIKTQHLSEMNYKVFVVSKEEDVISQSKLIKKEKKLRPYIAERLRFFEKESELHCIISCHFKLLK